MHVCKCMHVDSYLGSTALKPEAARCPASSAGRQWAAEATCTSAGNVKRKAADIPVAPIMTPCLMEVTSTLSFFTKGKNRTKWKERSTCGLEVLQSWTNKWSSQRWESRRNSAQTQNWFRRNPPERKDMDLWYCCSLYNTLKDEIAKKIIKIKPSFKEPLRWLGLIKARSLKGIQWGYVKHAGCTGAHVHCFLTSS